MAGWALTDTLSAKLSGELVHKVVQGLAENGIFLSAEDTASLLTRTTAGLTDKITRAWYGALVLLRDALVIVRTEESPWALTHVRVTTLNAPLGLQLPTFILAVRAALEKLRITGADRFQDLGTLSLLDAHVIFGSEIAGWALAHIHVAHKIASPDRWFAALVLTHGPTLEELGLTGAYSRRDWEWALKLCNAPVILRTEQAIRTLTHIRLTHLVALLERKLAALVLTHSSAFKEFQITGTLHRLSRRTLALEDTPIILSSEHTRRTLTDIHVAPLVALLDHWFTALVLAHSATLEKLGLARAFRLRLLRFRALALGFQTSVILRPEHACRALTDIHIAHVVAHIRVLAATRFLTHGAAFEKLGLAWALDRAIIFVLDASIVGRAFRAKWTLTYVLDTHRRTCHWRGGSALILAQ